MFRKISGNPLATPSQGAAETDAHKRWLADLETVRQSLEGVIASSEQGFIDIAERLMDFSRRSAGMYETSRSVVQLMTGEGFSGITSGLSGLLEDLHTLINDSDRQLGKITGVLNQYRTILGTADKSLDTFAGIVLNLNMLGFLTRVENAHLACTNTGFISLTDDVKRLAGLIKVKSQDIHARAEGVQTSIEGALKGIQTFEKTRGARTGAMLEETVTHHRTLSGRYATAVTAAERISNMTSGIADATGRIIESLQFHDISRQQIEHVIQVIDTLCGHIDSPQCAPQDRAVLLRKVCTLQAAQLGQTQAEISQALERVKDSLTRIGQGVCEIVNATSETVLTADRTGVAFMDRISGGIEAVMEGLDATSSEESVLLETVRATCDQVSHMSIFVREIEELGDNLQLIALNARIQAAHLGTEGAALDAISGSIYTLSSDARQDTIHLSDVLSEVVRISQGAENDLGLAQERKREAVHTLMATMKDLKTSLVQVNDTVQGLVDELCLQGRALLTDIEASNTGITVHIEVRAVLEKVMAVLEGIHAEAMEVVVLEEASSTAEFLAELDQLYTMQSERHIHQMHATPACAGGETQAFPGDDLGENVELF